MILEILVSLPQTANDPDLEGHCILHSMIQLGWKTKLDLMLIYDRLGRSPLHHAAAIHDANVARRIIHIGANISHTDFDCKTSLMYVLDEGKFETINLLLSNGAEFDTLDVDGNHPYTTQCQEIGCPSMIDRLVDNGADINALNSLGISPVHLVG